MLFKDVEHWFVGLEPVFVGCEPVFVAHEQKNPLGIRTKTVEYLVEQRQAIAEGEEDGGGLAECLGFTPLCVCHRGLESAVAVQDVVPSDADAGTFAFEEPVIGSE